MTQGQIILGTIWLIWTVFSIKDVYIKTFYRPIDIDGNTLTEYSSIWVFIHFAVLIAYGAHTW